MCKNQLAAGATFSSFFCNSKAMLTNIVLQPFLKLKQPKQVCFSLLGLKYSHSLEAWNIAWHGASQVQRWLLGWMAKRKRKKWYWGKGRYDDDDDDPYWSHQAERRQEDRTRYEAEASGLNKSKPELNEGEASFDGLQKSQVDAPPGLGWTSKREGGRALKCSSTEPWGLQKAFRHWSPQIFAVWKKEHALLQPLPFHQQ